MELDPNYNYAENWKNLNTKPEKTFLFFLRNGFMVRGYTIIRITTRRKPISIERLDVIAATYSFEPLPSS